MSPEQKAFVSTSFLDDRGQLLQTVLSVAPTAVIVLDTQGTLRMFNRECERISGYAAREAVNRNVFDLLIPPDLREDVYRDFLQFLSGNAPDRYETEWLTRRGDRRRMHFRATSLPGEDGKPAFVVATGVDVTETRKAECAARVSALQLQELIDACPALVGELDREYRFVFANREYHRWFGHDPASMRGRHVADVIGADAYAVMKPAYDRVLAGETVVFDGLLPYSPGGLRNVHGVHVPRRDADGAVSGLYIMAADLTEQFRLAAELYDAARRSQAVLDTAIDGVITINTSGRIVSFNHSAERMFGYSASEVIGCNVKMLMPEPYRSEHDEYLRHYLCTGEKRIIGLGCEVTAQRKDGSRFPIELAVGEFEEHGERCFTGFTRDISDRKKAEAEARERLHQLAHVTRLSAMGDLAAGISHEVNQPLTAILTTAQALLRMLQGSRATQELLELSLEQIAQQAERASKVIREMRSFLRKADDSNRTPQAVEPLLRGALELVHHEIRRNHIEVTLDVSDKLLPVEINAVQFEQVILNLLRNAIDAVVERDSARWIHIESRQLAHGEPQLEILVCDNGKGVLSEVRNRLFEPFVTTKPTGMGQGLSISRSIVRAHGGEIALVDSAQGACFRICLPSIA